LMLIVWGADVGAYVVGRAIGRRKLAPNVSPGKSWEGVFGGLLAVMLIAMVAGLMLSDTLEFDLSQWLGLFGVSIVVFIISILGDLVESVAKRHRGIKDSSKLLPGHGGIMDRIDSLTAAVPVFALLLTMVVI
jgi:phosphatidate cytidylyltransferase